VAVAYDSKADDPTDDVYSHSQLAERLSLKIIEIYAETGGDLDAMLRAAQLPCTQAELLSGATGAVSADALRRFGTSLTSKMAASLNDADGRAAMRSSDWRVILYCLGGARTLREAIARCIDGFEALDGRLGRMTLRTRAGIAELHLNSLRTLRTKAGCVVDLMGVANFHGLFGWLIAQRLPLNTVAMDYDRTGFDALALPDLPIPLLLSAGWTGFAFPATYLDFPVARTADEMIDWPRHSFLFMDRAPIPAIGVAEKARRFTFKSLIENHRLPPFSEIVAHLRASPATLRRRLAEEGTSYRQIKSRCRRELGLELLRGSTLTIEQISDRLDFCDSDAFRSAFRDWLDVSPSQYRRSAKAR
jgi:AraC-like DNA-binding protein